MLGGLYLGDRLLDGHDFTPGQGIVVELSSMAGALVGGGLGYLVTPGDSDSTDAKIIATGAVLGAVAGFGLSYTGLDTETRRPDGTRAPGLSLQLAPDLAPGHKGLVLAGAF
jgi:hypothetical protein